MLPIPDGPPLTFTPYINELQPNAWRQSGARIGKWQFYNGMTSSLDNDWAIFRYADILLSKAEAVARKNSDWNNALTFAIVNQIRTQHGGVTPYAVVTADNFLAERAREMFAETFHRQDLIRFGKYNSAWRFHPADPADNIGPKDQPFKYISYSGNSAKRKSELKTKSGLLIEFKLQLQA